MAKGTAGESCLCHGGQEAERVGKSRGRGELLFQFMLPGPISCLLTAHRPVDLSLG